MVSPVNVDKIMPFPNFIVSQAFRTNLFVNTVSLFETPVHLHLYLNRQSCGSSTMHKISRNRWTVLFTLTIRKDKNRYPRRWAVPEILKPAATMAQFRSQRSNFFIILMCNGNINWSSLAIIAWFFTFHAATVGWSNMHVIVTRRIK